MERSGLAALVELVERSGMIQLESALEGLSPDGPIRKTAKSKLLEVFSLDPILERLQDHVSFVDMGLIWQLAT